MIDRTVSIPHPEDGPILKISGLLGEIILFSFSQSPDNFSDKRAGLEETIMVEGKIIVIVKVGENVYYVDVL